MVADLDRLAIPHEWSGGYSEWMPTDELLKKEHLFPITAAIFEMIAAGIPFREDVCIYSDDEY